MTESGTHKAAVRRKSTLFCRTCDHASPIDGDWRRRERGETVVYVCPVCETRITERPRRDDGDDRQSDGGRSNAAAENRRRQALELIYS
ncbi:hypothetical protein [Halopiger xanaduensis]|uniref:DUF8106 domain-containing protein n=1 Tax=Halopiger xanaduensis (strain DSM 18323 / JCM 14033 / SH-6) TaxID=797210 RepID=F8D4V6_HALXS|nr:hypothetical protein Halxa_2967 [Halopiger xanaduensis SH-6]